MSGSNMSQILKNAMHLEGKRAVPPSDCPFLNSVDDALCVFGDSVKQSIYFHLNRNHNLSREMIPIKAEAFEDAMKVMFGEGAKMILRLVMKNSYIDAGLEPPPETYHLSSLRKIRRKLSEPCSLRGKECHLEKCVYFNEEGKTE